ACTNIIATPYGLHHLIHKHKTLNKQIITCYKSGPKKHESEGKEKKGAGSQANLELQRSRTRYDVGEPSRFARF
ncbi:MAG TPA: hypothetical protein VGY91_13970, partial [Chthoniobacterales bacterium]|nr:hypothetical protein [Chthoniobacterales bacterium]